MKKAVFNLDRDEAKSSWNVATDSGDFTVAISELFPSGLYDVHEVKSESFGEALIKRLEAGDPRSVMEYLKSNRATVNIADAKEVLSSEEVVRIVGEFVPLNDTEREFRDELRGVSRGS